MIGLVRRVGWRGTFLGERELRGVWRGIWLGGCLGEEVRSRKALSLPGLWVILVEGAGDFFNSVIWDFDSAMVYKVLSTPNSSKLRS